MNLSCTSQFSQQLKICVSWMDWHCIYHLKKAQVDQFGNQIIFTYIQQHYNIAHIIGNKSNYLTWFLSCYKEITVDTMYCIGLYNYDNNDNCKRMCSIKTRN